MPSGRRLGHASLISPALIRRGRSPAGSRRVSGVQGLSPLPGGAGGGAPRVALRGFQVAYQPLASVSRVVTRSTICGVGEVAVEEQGRSRSWLARCPGRVAAGPGGCAAGCATGW
jgi:hypothetical protein